MRQYTAVSELPETGRNWSACGGVGTQGGGWGAVGQHPQWCIAEIYVILKFACWPGFGIRRQEEEKYIKKQHGSLELKRVGIVCCVVCEAGEAVWWNQADMEIAG